MAKSEIYWKKRTYMALLIAFILVVLAIGCGGGASFRHSPPDTITTIVVYGAEGSYRYGEVRRISIDSFMFADVDSSTMKKKWTRHRIHELPFPDTIKEKGVVVMDSTGKKPKMGVRWVMIYPQFVVRDMNMNIDSLIKANKK